jgi:hypothetical protein
VKTKKFSTTFVLEVDKDSSVLSSMEWAHNEDIRDLVEDVFYDVDDVKVHNIKVQELP